jgi:hypothetical protein
MYSAQNETFGALQYTYTYTEDLQHLTSNIHNIIIKHSLKNVKRTTHMYQPPTLMNMYV